MPDQPELDSLALVPVALRKQYDEVRGPAWLIPSVTGVDVGTRYDADGNPMGSAVRVHTTDPDDAKIRALVAASAPDEPRIAIVRAGYGRDVGEKALAPPSSDRSQSVLPLQPGAAIVGDGQAAGTLGLIVFDTAGQAYALSNAHVLAARTDPEPSGRTVYQPPPIPGPKPNRRVGITKGRLRDTRGDAAIAALDETVHDDKGKEHRLTYCRGQWPSPGAATVVVERLKWAEIGDPVSKSGAATGVTTGVVDGVGEYEVGEYKGAAEIVIGFRVVPPRSNRFARLSATGDSGAVWHTSYGVGLGLHVGGPILSGGEPYAIACHLPTVLRELGVDIRPPNPAPAALVPCPPHEVKDEWLHRLLAPLVQLVKSALRSLRR